MEAQKFSLIQIDEDISGDWGHSILKQCFRVIETFDTLSEAKENQKKCSFGTIILPSY